MRGSTNECSAFICDPPLGMKHLPVGRYKTGAEFLSYGQRWDKAAVDIIPIVALAQLARKSGLVRPARKSHENRRKNNDFAGPG